MEQLSQEVTTPPPSRTPEEDAAWVPCEFEYCSPYIEDLTKVTCVTCDRPFRKSSFCEHAVKCAQLPLAKTRHWHVHRDGLVNKRNLAKDIALSDPLVKMSFEGACAADRLKHPNSVQPAGSFKEHRKSSDPPVCRYHMFLLYS